MSDVEPNPYQPRYIDDEAERVGGMTIGEKLFTALVVVFAGFMLASLALWHFFIIPGTEAPGVFYFVASIIWLEFFALAVTAGLNLYHGKLLIVPTVIQGVALCLVVYLFPFGLIAFLLIYRRVKRETSEATIRQGSD